MRQLLIDRVTQQGWTQAAAGISVRTVAKWIHRARHGDRQLEDGSSRPHRQPRTLDLARRTAILRGVGDEYVHVAIDDATRVADVDVRRSQRRRACAAFLRNARVWFRRRGVTVRRLLTDNGAGYTSRRFAGVCRTWKGERVNALVRSSNV